MIELMRSEAMTGALKRVGDVKAVDDINWGSTTSGPPAL
jgi:hypothetical protein